MIRLREFLPDGFPKIVCLCGSTRFWPEFQKANLRETLAGNIVLSIGGAIVTEDEDSFGHMRPEESDRVKRGLDDLHMRKIDLADEVLILNAPLLNGKPYVGESTARELAYARQQGKVIRFLNPEVPA